MEKSKTKTTFSIRQMTIAGMLSAISIFLGLTGLGFIPIPFLPIKATIFHLPVIIGAIVEGPIVGALVGLVFGLFSMYQAFTAPMPTSFIFWNPLIAILPRVLIGIVSYYTYNFLKKKINNQSITIGISAVLGTFTNTVGVMGLTYIIYLDRYAKTLGLNKHIAATTIFTVVGFNGTIEAILGAIICISVILTLFKIRK